MLFPTAQHLDIPENAEADLAILVEVRVEADSPSACRHEAHSRWADWVVRGAPNQEVEKPTFIGRIERACDDCMYLNIK